MIFTERCAKFLHGKKKERLLVICFIRCCFSFFFYFFLWPVNSGQLRNYVYLGLFLGYAGYFAFLHKQCYRLVAQLAYFLAMILRFIGRILAFPFHIIGKIVVKPLAVLFHLIKASFLRWYRKWQDSRQKVGEDLSENL